MTSFIAIELRRLIGVISLAALLVGAPWALYRLGMPLLPDHLPSIGEIWDGLTERDTGQVFLGTLVIIGFIAWAVFAISLLADLASRITGRPAIRLPGLHLPQAVASTLVCLIIAGTITTSAAPAAAAPPGMPALPQPTIAVATTPAAHTATTPARTVSPTHANRPKTRVAPLNPAWKVNHTDDAETTSASTKVDNAGRVWIVQPGDTLWHIAEQTLGNPLRYTQLVDINEGRTQPDGKTLVAADFLLPGWTIHLPPDATLPAEQQPGSGEDAPDEVVAEPGDTLSQIALDTLGDASRYHQLAAINHIDDPDLIYPGEMIEIPGAVADSQSDDPETEVDDQGTERDNPDSTTHSYGSDASDPSAEQHDPTTSEPPDHQTAVTATAPRVGTNETEPDARENTAPAITDQHDHREETKPPEADATPPKHDDTAVAKASSSQSGRTLWTLGGATGLLAAIAWAGLLVTRRRLEQSRKVGQHPARPTPEEAHLDRALREQAGTANPETINRAMRAITATVAENAPDGFDVILIGADTIELHPTVPANPPKPFHGSDTAWTARLEDLDDNPDDSEDAEERLAAIPALVTLGTTGDGRIVAIDLEHYGTIALSGDEDRCRKLRNHMIVELAQSPWTDGIHLTLSDVPDGIQKLDPDRIDIADDLDRAGKALTAHTKRIRQMLGDTPITRARTSQLFADAWEPHILIANSSDLVKTDHLADLVEALRADQPAAAGLVAVGGNLDTEPLVLLDEDGTLHIPSVLDDQAIYSAGISDEELAILTGMFNPSLSRADTSPARDRTEPTDGGEVNPLHVVTPGSGTNLACPDTMPSPADNFDAESATSGHDEPEAVPGVRTGSGLHAPQPKPAGGETRSLDDDVAEWYGGTPTRPHVAVLGPAEVTGVGSPPTRIERRMTEYAVYLALHPNGVSVDKFVTDLWPNGKPPIASARRADMSRLRTWLGTSADTDVPFVPQSIDGHYRLNGRLVDAELFSLLCSRAGEQANLGDAHAALTDYQTALGLVRGSVLPEAAGPSYAWLSNSDRMEDRFLPMQVIDAAHAAAGIALAIGDTDAAEKAATVGRLVDADSSIPLCDLVRAAAAVDDHATARSWADVLLAINEVDTPDDLPDHVRDIVIDLYLRDGCRSQHRAS